MALSDSHGSRARENRCDPGLTESGLPLPDPFPEYIVCPECGEPEVETWCYETLVFCHACGAAIRHRPPACFGSDHCAADHKDLT